MPGSPLNQARTVDNSLSKYASLDIDRQQNLQTCLIKALPHVYTNATDAGAALDGLSKRETQFEAAIQEIFKHNKINDTSNLTFSPREIDILTALLTYFKNEKRSEYYTHMLDSLEKMGLLYFTQYIILDYSIRNRENLTNPSNVLDRRILENLFEVLSPLVLHEQSRSDLAIFKAIVNSENLTLQDSSSSPSKATLKAQIETMQKEWNAKIDAINKSIEQEKNIMKPALQHIEKIKVILKKFNSFEKNNDIRELENILHNIHSIYTKQETIKQELSFNTVKDSFDQFKTLYQQKKNTLFKSERPQTSTLWQENPIIKNIDAEINMIEQSLNSNKLSKKHSA